MATIKNYRTRLTALKSEFTSFRELYGDLADYHLAHRGRFLVTDVNKGHKRNTKQINNTSRLALRTLSSGMMSGITSPARPWFRLSTGDANLDDEAAVKDWLFSVQNIMYRVFSVSNTYNSLHTIYQDIGCFGISAMGVYEDFENVIRCEPYTVGSYFLANNGYNQVDTFYQEYDKTVGQLIKEFGEENCSDSVVNMWKNGGSERWVTVTHVVEPNDNRDGSSPAARDKKFRSIYFENSAGSGRELKDKYLKRSGFDEFPIMTPRWDVTGDDVYATDCPGMIALGDTKALQLIERRKYQAVDKVVNPPMQGPTGLRQKLPNGMPGPGDILWLDGDGSTGGLRSIYEQFRPDLNAIGSIGQEAEQRIKTAFFEDLFLMLSNTDRREITAREVAEKHEEKLLMLGPVLERLHNELLDPLINRTFNILQRNGVLPLAPESLQNREITVEYVSVLAQAQRMVATGGVERLVGFIGQVATAWPEARHKLNALQAVDDYANAIGVNPAIIRSDDEAQEINAAEQQAQQMATMMMAAQQAADIAQTTSQVDLSENNVAGVAAKNAGVI